MDGVPGSAQGSQCQQRCSLHHSHLLGNWTLPGHIQMSKNPEFHVIATGSWTQNALSKEVTHTKCFTRASWHCNPGLAVGFPDVLMPGVCPTRHHCSSAQVAGSGAHVWGWLKKRFAWLPWTPKKDRQGPYPSWPKQERSGSSTFFGFIFFNHYEHLWTIIDSSSDHY